jgi:hypothetical protein
MNAKAAIALTAGFGGVSPNLLRIAIALQRKEDPGVDGSYLIGLLLFALLGAGVALIWGEKDFKRAYYLGLGLPSLMQVAVATATQNQTPPTITPDQTIHVGASSAAPPPSFSLFASAAYAQTSPPQEQPERPAHATSPDNAVNFQKDRQLTLVLEDVPEGAELLFTSSDHHVISRVNLEESSKSDKGSQVKLKVPDFASSAYLRIGSSLSEFMQLRQNDGSTTAFKVDVDHSRWGGFLKALGVQDASPLKFDIDKIQSPKL